MQLVYLSCAISSDIQYCDAFGLWSQAHFTVYRYTLKSDGVIDQFQTVSYGIVFAHFHFFPICGKTKEGSNRLH